MYQNQNVVTKVIKISIFLDTLGGKSGVRELKITVYYKVLSITIKGYALKVFNVCLVFVLTFIIFILVTMTSN